MFTQLINDSLFSKRSKKETNEKEKDLAGMMENGPLLSQVVDPPGTKGGPRAGNFPARQKTPFVPGGRSTRD